MESKVQFLKNVTPFNVLPEDVLANVATLLQEEKHSREAVIYKQEVTTMKGVDIIVEGEYESFFYDSAQNKRLVEHYHAGYCYGGISVLLNRKKSLRTVIAKKGTVVYTLPRKDFSAFKRSPVFTSNIRFSSAYTLTKSTIGVIALLISNTSSDPRVVVLMFLKKVKGGSYCNAFLAIRKKNFSIGF